MKKTLFLGAAAFALASCQNTVPTAQIQGTQGFNNTSVVRLQAPSTAKTQVLRMSEKPGASFTLRVNSNEGFAIKQSTNGTAASVAADIDSYDVFLIESATTPSGTITSAAVRGEALGLASTSNAFLFENVSANTPGSKYYVVIKAKDSDGNVLNKNLGMDHDGDFISVSDGGGDSDGGVSVNDELELSSTAELTMNIELLDAVSPELDAQATITDGADLSGSTTISSP